jgi:hypothetical protein
MYESVPPFCTTDHHFSEHIIPSRILFLSKRSIPTCDPDVEPKEVTEPRHCLLPFDVLYVVGEGGWIAATGNIPGGDCVQSAFRDIFTNCSAVPFGLFLRGCHFTGAGSP